MKVSLFAIFYSLFVIFSVSVVVDSQAKGSAATCRRTCGSSTGQTICASNGITYTNSCRFECAKLITPRLRIVKNAPCGSTSLSEYRRGQKSSRSSG